MQFEGALITEQGVTFGIMLVQEHVIDDPTQRDEILAWATNVFQAPAVLMGDRRGRTWGRADLVRFLESVQRSQIPWQRYTVAA